MKEQYKALIPFYGIYWIASDNNMIWVFENHTHIFPLSIVTQTTTLFITFLMSCMI